MNRTDQPNVQSSAHEEHVKGWLLYDSSCGFCDRWVRFWEPILARRGFAVEPLQSDFARSRIQLSDDVLLSDLRLLLHDGQLVEGADAYRYLMRRIYWAYPLYVISIVPVCSTLFDWGYRRFRDHRHRISRVCRLPSHQVQDEPRNQFESGRQATRHRSP